MANHEIEQVQKDVRDFMDCGNQHCPDSPCLPSMEVRLLRVRLIAEELVELAQAYGVYWTIEEPGSASPRVVVFAELASKYYPDNTAEEVERVVEAYDAVLDLMYVVAGTAVAQGTQMAPGWVEVQRSNMAKFGPGGTAAGTGNRPTVA